MKKGKKQERERCESRKRRKERGEREREYFELDDPNAICLNNTWQSASTVRPFVHM
jgi:hypothetical protein